MTAEPQRPLTPDFDSDPERFAANQAATQQFSAGGDVHQQVADRIAALNAGRVLDLGGGDGTLARLLARHDVPTVVLDRRLRASRATTRGSGRCGAIALHRWVFWRHRSTLDALRAPTFHRPR
jgi:hypothetical protein